MSVARRRKYKRKNHFDRTMLDDCVLISNDYKNKLIIGFLLALFGSFIKGIMLGYMFSKKKF